MADCCENNSESCEPLRGAESIEYLSDYFLVKDLVSCKSLYAYDSYFS